MKKGKKNAKNEKNKGQDVKHNKKGNSSMKVTYNGKEG